MSQTLTSADQTALDRLALADPIWTGQGTAAELTGLPEHVLLHAGPAFPDPSQITAPILNSARVAAVYQGLAREFDQAKEKILSGEILLQPAQDHGVATPLASVVSMAMSLHIVRDGVDDKILGYAPINGGNGPAMRLGQCGDNVLTHLEWINGEFASQLAPVAEKPISLLDIARDSLKKEDDCHGRTMEATGILQQMLSIQLDDQAREFLQKGPSFFLNVWMAAVKCMLRSAEGIEGSSLVTAAGANGLETGIQISSMPGRWFTARANSPEGSLDVDVDPSRKLGAIGDSALVDAFGLGAMAMNFAPAQQAGLGKYMPEGGLALPEKLLGMVHPRFGELKLRVGTLAKAVVDQQVEPVVSLGVLDSQGELGRLGGGIYIQPASPFRDAVNAM